MQQLNFFEVLDKTQTNCIVCGKHFKKKNINHKYCSIQCTGKSTGKKQTKKIYYQKNKETFLEKAKMYRNLPENKKRAKLWRIKNKKRLDKWNSDNRERQLILKKEREKKRYLKNKDKILEKQKLKSKTNIQYKLRHTISRRMRSVLFKQKTIKSKKTLELLGCSLEEAKIYLEKQFKEGMAWENHGNFGWHIDHIIPCASFDLTDPEQQKKCFHYTNLQPLWCHENLSKGKRNS